MLNNKVNVLCLCAVRNRSEKTKNSISKLKLALDNNTSVLYRIVVVDDGSSDDTVDTLKTNFSDIDIIYGDGSLYWSGGMIKGFLESWNNMYSHILVFNDDSDFVDEKLSNALNILTDSRPEFETSILVGAFSDNKHSCSTYGVQKRKSRFSPYSFTRLPIKDEIQFGDTLNMNFAIIPKVVLDKIGFLDGKFTHAMADFDFGLRAKKAGFKIIQLPSVIGICPRNTVSNTWEDPNLTFRKKIESLHSVKNFPPNERAYLLIRHAGIFMPIYFLYPYIKIIISTLFGRGK